MVAHFYFLLVNFRIYFNPLLESFWKGRVENFFQKVFPTIQLLNPKRHGSADGFGLGN